MEFVVLAVILLISFKVNFGPVRNVDSFCQSCRSAQFCLESTAVSVLVTEHMSFSLHYKENPTVFL